VGAKEQGEDRRWLYIDPDPLPCREREDREDDLDGCHIDALGARRTVLGDEEIGGGLSAYWPKALAPGIPGAVGAHGADLALSLGGASEPLTKAVEPIQTADVYRDPDPGSLINCLTMNSHVDHSSIGVVGTIPLRLTLMALRFV
jgi:hypothetical protein